MGAKGHRPPSLKGIAYYLLLFWLKLLFNLILHRIRPSSWSFFLYYSQSIESDSDLMHPRTTISHLSHLWMTSYPLFRPEYERFGPGWGLSLPPSFDLFSHFHMSLGLSPTATSPYPLVQLLPLCVLLIIPLSLNWHLLQYPLLVR